MPVPFYMDVHVPGAITRQLRLRGVDVLTAQDDKRTTAGDEDLLARATQLGRLLVTHDVLFRVRAEDWQRRSQPFAGLAFGSQLGTTIGQCVEDLELIAKCSHIDEWRSVVQYLPLSR